ncbi:MAG TPA: sigma-70 family RNA polymerase sigma factor [Solirubrobacterales bacterium]|nr:sigma-70 family RNA polymerase sigma factor [Solirubrobacterales bacterium]
MDDPILDSDAISASATAPAEFARVFDRHFDAVHSYLQRRVGPDLADELSSQTFLVAFDGRARYDTSRADARPWLFGIATNLLRRHRRREVRELRAYARSGVDPVLDAFDGIEERLDASRLRRELAEVLANVPADETDTLLLYAWAELTYPEIAEALGVPVGTVRSRLSRVRGRIRELLDLEGAIDECQPAVNEGGQR